MAKKIAKKCAYVVGYQAVEWGEKIDNKNGLLFKKESRQVIK
jgi:hypothetical protein